ncbi:protein of unknown function [Catalinimonas alkaloidigena]|uniref:Smr domain-containing protein n=1 Tax=Catalinimonas alkaloidigena TaxID=1075417 RepID=A0A1G9QMA8_9BACT|nr:Smr/MutS family protein [Catalinimonas alkaloidigena]SDM11961.1 protein of unknown function [Catalinimonas alkaloidigena]
MNIGDKVRLLRGTEEGVVTRFVDDKVVEVTIDGDFPIPVLRTELVVVATDEERVFRREKSEVIAPGKTTEKTKATTATASQTAIRGLFLAFVPLNDRALTIHLINNTDLDMLVTLGRERNNQYQGLLSTLLKPRTTLQSEQVSTADFEQWPAYVFQVLSHRNGPDELRTPLLRRFRFRASSFFKQKKSAPLLNKEAYLFQIDDELSKAVAPSEPTSEVDLNVIREQLATNQGRETAAGEKSRRGESSAVIDLHVEQITKDHARLNRAEKLELQLATFQRALDRAVAAGLDEVTFIHGVGNGVLRQEIHRRLSQEPHVEWYQDAQKEKFGYGATRAKIK